MRSAYTFDYAGIEVAVAADSLDEAQNKVSKLLGIKNGGLATLHKVVDLELAITHQVITQNAALSGGVSVSSLASPQPQDTGGGDGK